MTVRHLIVAGKGNDLEKLTESERVKPRKILVELKCKKSSLCSALKLNSNPRGAEIKSEKVCSVVFIVQQLTVLQPFVGFSYNYWTGFKRMKIIFRY